MPDKPGDLMIAPRVFDCSARGIRPFDVVMLCESASHLGKMIRVLLSV